jgi:hypothetical protein
MKQDQIYTSSNYHEFIFVEGNREIKSSKVSKMIDSIKTFGLVNPIVVDQYKQIIDGQNRFEWLGLAATYFSSSNFLFNHYKR